MKTPFSSSLFFLVVLFCISDAIAQSIPDQWIVMLHNASEIETLQKQLNLTVSTSRDKIPSALDAQGKVWLLHHKAKDPDQFLANLRNNQAVKLAQPNYKIEELRGPNTPNDGSFEEQWWANTIQLPQTWETVTGGVTARGDTIVIAVFDAGFDVTHPDLIENLWQNRSESTVPNGLDEDQNGFVDDIFGWNTSTNSDFHTPHPHGTGVVGVMAARGNNAIGLAGVNWQVKWMPVSGITTDAQLFAAANYVYVQRKRYTASNGTAGAFVVAVNMSLGVTGGNPALRPLWCEAIALLDSVRILTVAAAPNLYVDVDAYGDLPCACPNPSLITVSGSDKNDQLAEATAYGKNTIDLVAPSVEITSTAPNSGYDLGTTGTSLAAPQVAGLVALLYSLPLNVDAFDRYFEGSAVHLDIKKQILEGVDTNLSLKNLVGSAGRLNTYSAVENQLKAVNEAANLAPLLLSIYPNPLGEREFSQIEVLPYEPSANYAFTCFNALGQIIFTWNSNEVPGENGVWKIPNALLPSSISFIAVVKAGQSIKKEMAVVKIAYLRD